MTAVSKLPEQWREDQRAYPDHIGGQIAAAAVRCCADELDRVLAGRPRAASGIATTLAEDKPPFDVLIAMSKLLSLDGDDTAVEVRERAVKVLAARYGDPVSCGGVVDVLARAGLLAGGDASTTT